MRVTLKPSPNTSAATTIVESEIVTSPTWKPKKAARSDDMMSVRFDPPWRERQHQRAQDDEHPWATPLASTPICSSERRRRPVLA